MHQETQITLIEKAFSRMEQRSTELGDTEHAWPIKDYRDKDRYEKEVTMIRRHPIIVAHSSQLRKPGDFITKTIIGLSIIVVRSTTGGASAFLNTCRHRGARLLSKDCGGKLKHFSCPYHGWTYDTDGRLIALPDKQRGFPNIDQEQLGLIRLPTEERHGFVWVVPWPAGKDSTGEPMPVATLLGEGLDCEIASFEFDSYVFYRNESWTGDFNWKSGIEQFLENYHFPVLHGNSTDYIFNNSVLLCDQIGTHFRAVAPKKSIRDLKTLDRSQWDLRPHATVLYTIFPLSVFFIESNHFSLLQIFPEEVGRSRIDVTHVVGTDGLQMRTHWEANIRLFLAAIREDLDMCEIMQEGFMNGATDTVIFGRNEVGLHRYRTCIEQALGHVHDHAEPACRTTA